MNAHGRIRFSVPPSVPVIYDQHGVEIRDVAGPFNEGGTLVLTCEAVGGNEMQRRQSLPSSLSWFV